MATVRFWREAGTQQRSIKSATLAMASAGGFLGLIAILSFVPDAPVTTSPVWPLRGTLAGNSLPFAEKPLPRAVSRPVAKA